AGDHVHEGEPALHWWRDEWVRWSAGAYRTVLDQEVKAGIGRRVKDEFDRINRAELARWHECAEETRGAPPVARKVTTRLTSDVTHALSGLVGIAGDVEQPAWISGIG